MADEASIDGTSSSQFTGESSESTIEINIKTLDSQIYTFRVNKDMLVSTLKEKIVDATGVPVGQQRLIFRGKVLKDDHVLSAYHLEDGHTLHLVARQPVQVQPTPGTGSENAARNNGNESTGLPHSRVGQVSHSVVLGSINIAEPGDGMVADISRIVGAVLNSLGVGNLAPTGGLSNASSAAVGSNQAPSNVETEATQNASVRPQPGNPTQTGFTVLNHPFQSLQISHLPQHIVVPDSLTTLSEFINRMELALQYGGSQSSPPANVRNPPRSEAPSSSSRGLPTPEVLCAVLAQVQQFLTGNASNALSHIIARLEREAASTDTVVRGQIQSEAMHVGLAMQHLGAMFLELGRTLMTLRMGQTPADAMVNAGPAVYISSTGPNPIMVQPSPLQTSSLLGVTSPSPLSGLSGPFGVGDPSRSINIHIGAGTSAAPGASSVGTRANLGEAIRGERSNAEQASTNGNGSGDSVPTRLPSRTVVAAIPARSAGETASHVLSVIYPVHVSSQQSVPIPSAAPQASRSTVSSGAHPNTTNPVPQPSSQSNAPATFLAQLNAHIASALSGNVRSQSSYNPSMRSTVSQDSCPSTSNGAQPTTASPFPQTLETDTISRLGSHSAQNCEQLVNALSGNAQGQSSSGSVLRTNTPCTNEGPQAVSSDMNDVNRGTDSVAGPNASEGSGSGRPIVLDSDMPEGSGSGRQVLLDSDMPGRGGHQLPAEGLHFSNDADIWESSDMGSLTTKSEGGPAACRANDTLSSNLGIGSSVKKLDSGSTVHTSWSNMGQESDRPTPLGLGLGGLQPKRRGKPAKDIGKDDASRDMPSANQNQQSISRGQKVLQSLVSQSSDRNRVNVNGSSIPLPSVINQIMDNMPLEGQSAGGEIDAANMISHALQNPTLNSLMTGVAEQAGIGSPDTLKSMLEQCTRSPGVMNTLNGIVQQVGQSEGIGGLLAGMGSSNGGIDLSRMIQQMMPVVSQALGRGSIGSAPAPDVQSEPPQCNDIRTGGNGMLDDGNSQIDVQQAVERIERHDSPGNIFRSILESAGFLLGEGNNFGDLIEELGADAKLIDEFMEMLQRRIRYRLHAESTPNDDS